MTEAAWTELVRALGAELERLTDLRAHADHGAELMLAMDVPGIERWAEQQSKLLAELAELAVVRSEALRRCVPSAPDASPSGGLAARMTLLSIIQFAPQWVARRLRTMRARLRELRDEIALVSSRNEILVRQALEFTEELGRSLASNEKPAAAYNARGQVAASRTGAGELLELSL